MTILSLIKAIFIINIFGKHMVAVSTTSTIVYSSILNMPRNNKSNEFGI